MCLIRQEGLLPMISPELTQGKRQSPYCTLPALHPWFQSWMQHHYQLKTVETHTLSFLLMYLFSLPVLITQN